MRVAQKIAVIMGGISAEREVSLTSGRECADALRGEGFDVTEVDAAPNTLLDDLQDAAPDVIFNALHGDWGEDGEVHGLLERFGKPYTHSGVAASKLAMNKEWAKTVFRLHGITVPGGGATPRARIGDGGVLPAPYVVKPNGSGSSASVYIVEEETPAILSQIMSDDGLGAEPIIEPFIPGRELTVAVMDGHAICVTEIIPKSGWYDYHAKYGKGGSRHVVEPKLPDGVAERAMAWAETAHLSLGCRGVSRADYRFDDTEWPENHTESDVVNRLVMLELNTQPGMTPTSLVPEQCAHVGMSFGELCRWMVEDATWPRTAQTLRGKPAFRR